MLVHICCSVDSHYFLKRVQQEYPKQKLIGYFYNPNIHPQSEYELRLMDVKRSCEMLEIPLAVGEYDYKKWYEQTKALAKEPEKGKRCESCFVERFEATAQKAKELGLSSFTSTLAVSPKKSIKQLQSTAEAVAKRYGIVFKLLDFKKDGGTAQQNRLAKIDKLYRQNYCGCLYALKQQREAKDKLSYELFNSLDYSREPNSFEQKAALYENRRALELTNSSYELVKMKRLNYRLLHGYVKDAKGVIPSFILPYSVIQKGFSRGKVEKVINNIAYFNRDEIKLCDIALFNQLGDTAFKSVKELIGAKLEFEVLLKVRKAIVGEYDLSTIIVTDTIPMQKLYISVQSRYFLDTIEELRSHG